MAKTNTTDQSQPISAGVSAPAKPAAAEPAPEPQASRAQILTFAVGVVIFLVLARALGALLPGIRESQLERWVMLGFGVFLAAFLAWLK